MKVKRKERRNEGGGGGDADHFIGWDNAFGWIPALAGSA
jgi:hypothetical protein